MATIKDVAKAAGVGVGTASVPSTETVPSVSPPKKKVEETAKSLGFVPNQLARNFKKQSTGCVAIIVPTVFHPFFAKMVLYCESELYKVGYRLIVVSSQDDKNKEARMLEMIRQQRVDGIIFITHYDHGNIDPDLPIVSVDRHVGAGFPYVTSDNYAMSRRAVELLREKGARNIGCVCGATVVESETKYRYTAYLDAMRDCGAEPHLLLMPVQARSGNGRAAQVLFPLSGYGRPVYGQRYARFRGVSRRRHARRARARPVADRGVRRHSGCVGFLPQTDNGAAGHSQNGAERRGIAPCPHHRQERSRKGRDPAELVLGETTK